MSLLRRNDPMHSVRQTLEQFFNEVSDRCETPQANWIPALDVFEGKDALHVQIELPGMDQKDLALTFHDGVLTIRGEKKQEWQTEGHEVHRVERRYGSFARSLSLPATVDPAQAAASFKNGVLTILLPKREEAKPREIQIKVD
ncbi:MAG: Hsp20/alpha crystallin family protein [Planctomycetes bacterium]|nr:Hsp20/alpha crystallin family protein [Planctomycetota bacterium]